VTRRNRTPEREFQRTLVQVLEAFGWEVNHTYPLMTKHGWRTGTTAVGWPDLTALREPRILAIEVKGDHTPVEPAQLAWLSLFATVPCARAWVLRPAVPAWPLVQAWIRRPKTAPRSFGFDPMPAPEARALLAKVRADKKAARARRRQRRAEADAQPPLPI
jgi:hypothetical protein